MDENELSNNGYCICNKKILNPTNPVYLQIGRQNQCQ